ncbi:MAG: nicotinamide riboside transporter PnuC [Fibromonadales bacterium]|nr:nicotinamide riboside transporter PnuC [Fibromonadales bacterium]
MSLFSIDTIFLNIGDYPLSYIEFAGTVLYFLSVCLLSRKNIITWPAGILSVILYFMLFYQIQLYSDMLEQIYYFIICIIGWITWHKRKSESTDIQTSWSDKKGIWLSILVVCVATGALSFCTCNFHNWFPVIFPEAASFPVLDASTTVMSFVAMYLVTIRRNEGWVYWIIVDIVAIWLYWVKDVHFISVQYVFLFGMAVYGLLNWKKNAKNT